MDDVGGLDGEQKTIEVHSQFFFIFFIYDNMIVVGLTSHTLQLGHNKSTTLHNHRLDGFGLAIM